MLYKNNTKETIDRNDFRNPPPEYRGAPFWAWNGDIEEAEMLRQFDVFRQMGFGGAHLHVRTGLTKEYLGEEHMALVKSVVNKADKDGMYAYLYDEDRWPSGAAGGLVTKNKEFRARYLLFTPYPYSDSSKVECNMDLSSMGSRAENGTLIACFDVELDSSGCLAGSRLIGENEPAEHFKWYAYLETSLESPWYNNQTYVDTLNKKAIDRFINITYNKYENNVGEFFGSAVPSIFTDEPQFTRKTAIKEPFAQQDIFLPWTDDLPDTFFAAYGLDLVAGIPQLIWDLPEKQPSRIRYSYHDHVCERFTNAFADNCGKWCGEHGLMLTGHMMQEPTLKSQTGSLGEAMRSYRAFDIPGIDMLCAKFEYTTAKQAQSAVHQYGREGMMSELYGVTNWDFDFRGHKLHGDWQAALGVTLRVPHLSWYSMKGEAKRDYPASISYQSPWWQEYRRIEDHFARVNTAMTRGTPVVKVGVIHPIESYWLHWGPMSTTQDERNRLDKAFMTVTEDLLFGGVDFDFISESLLPELCKAPGAPLCVGRMKYDAVIVPCCETLRATTLDALEKFRDEGGKLIFIGNAPDLSDAKPSNRGIELCRRSKLINLDKGEILRAVADERFVTLSGASGMRTDDLLYQLRQDTDCRWLFIAHGKEPHNKDLSRREELKIELKGKWSVEFYDTMTCEVFRPIQSVSGDKTTVEYRIYDYDSLLLRLTDYSGEAVENIEGDISPEREMDVPNTVEYRLSESNVMLLDQAQWALDDGEFNPEEELLRLDNECRKTLGWPLRGAAVAQPWCIKHNKAENRVHLRFTIHSEIDIPEAELALEDAEAAEIVFNGKTVDNRVVGYYVDKSIEKLPLHGIKSGENILEVTLPIGVETNLEWMYLLGNFGVKVVGKHSILTKQPDKLAFGDICSQGFPFYGGNIEYTIPIETEKGTFIIHSNRYRGACQTVSVDEGEEKNLFLPPYNAQFTVEAGKHIIHLKLYGHRRNSFGPVHLSDEKERWIGPDAWRSTGDAWSCQYCICPEGVLSSPTVFYK